MESHSDKEDGEESNSLKPSTKEEIKVHKKSAKVAPEGQKKKLQKTTTFLTVTHEELKQRGVGKCRLSVARCMRSKPVDIFIISLILLYTVLVVVYLAIDNIISESNTATLALQIFELILLFIFVVETILNFIGFGQLFLKDYWNIADITVILLAIVLVILDMTLTDGQLSGLLKLRGLFRLLRIGILFRKFEAIRKKRAAQRKRQTRDIFHLKAPAEIVNEILCNIRDMVENDDKLIEDINYCIKMVSSGKLYEANFEAPLGSDENVNDAINFFTNFQDKQSSNKVEK